MNNPNSNENFIEADVKKRIKKTLKMLILGFFVAFFILLSYVVYWGFFEESLLTSKLSPSGKSEVVINEYGNDFVGGSDTIKIYFKQDGITKQTKKVDVSLMESNHRERYNIVWLDENRVVVFCNKKVQRIATKNTECCHPIFSLFSRQCVC